MKSATLDSNIYVSAFEFGGIGARLLGMARAGRFRLDVSDAILDETVGVLRDKFGWDGYRMMDVRQKVAAIANLVIPMIRLEVVTEDPDDNRILECAVEARSEYIVTYDNDLLRLGQYGEIRILDAVKFLDSQLGSTQ